MPTPNFAIPKTHSVTVDLSQIVNNLQRATTIVFGVGATPRRRPEYPKPTEKFECHIGTLDKLQEFLQPAMDSSLPDYFRKTRNAQWVHILNFEDGAQKKHRILLTPTTILNTFSNERCSIDQGLAYYLNLALDITPPRSALDDTDALMAAYILFFGAGYMVNPEIRQFAPVVTPPVAPPKPPVEVRQLELSSIKGLFEMIKSCNNTTHDKLKVLYLRKAAKHAMNLAEDLRQNIQKDPVYKKKVADLIVHYENLVALQPEALEVGEVSRINSWLQPFLDMLFQSTTWQSQYNRFRGDLLKLGCKESTNPDTGLCHVGCPPYGIQFDIKKTNIHDRGSKTVAKQGLIGP